MTNHPLIDLLHQAAQTAREHDREAVARVELTVAGYKPEVTFQVNVKMRDAGLAWGTAVSADPVEAMVEALDRALRGEEARKTESQAIHHPNRSGAKALVELLEREYADQIAATKVELVPYKGWVVVVFPKPGQDLSELLPRVELRDLPATRPNRITPPAGPKPSAPVGQIGSAPEGGRASLTKDKLEAEYKAIFGKNPDRNIKKLDLAAMLDKLEAERKAGGGEPAAEEEEDLL